MYGTYDNPRPTMVYVVGACHASTRQWSLEQMMIEWKELSGHLTWTLLVNFLVDIDDGRDWQVFSAVKYAIAGQWSDYFGEDRMLKNTIEPTLAADLAQKIFGCQSNEKVC